MEVARGQEAITLVESPEQAPVTVCVLPAGKEAPGPYHSSHRTDRVNAETVHAVDAMLSVGGYTIVLEGITEASGQATGASGSRQSD